MLRHFLIFPPLLHDNILFVFPPQKMVIPNLKRLHRKRHCPSSQPKKKWKKECAVVLFQSRSS